VIVALARRVGPRQAAGLAGLAVFLVLLPAWLAIIGWYQGLLIEQQQAEVLDTVAARSVTLSSAISRPLARLRGLSAYVQAGPDDSVSAATLDPFVTTLLEGSTTVRYLTVAPAGVIRYVYPPDSSDVQLGSLAVAATGVPGTQSSRLVELARPEPLASGEIRLLAWQSVQKNGLPWGQVSMALDVAALLAEAGIGAAGEPLQMALRDDRGRVFFGQESVFAADPVEAPVFLPDGRWSLAAVPAGGWAAEVERPLQVFEAVSLAALLLLVALAYAVTARQARLSRAVAARTEALVEAQQAREVAALTERQKLARELHDSVSQAFYAITLGTKTARTLLARDPAQLAEPLDYIEGLAQGGLAETRSLIFSLRPEALEEEGLVAALEKQVAAVRSRHQLQVVTYMSQEPAVSLEVKEALYRITMEALNNVVKHAQAGQVTIRLSRRPELLVLLVADDGRGFDPNQSFPGHLGLRSMKERCQRIGGRCTLHSAPGKGTLLRVEVPLAAAGETS
jgi:signal transduction histidine kinase